MPVEREWAALPELPELPAEPKAPYGRLLRRPDPRDAEKFSRFARIKSFVELHMKSDAAYGAKTRAVDAAILHFKINSDRRAFYKLLRQEDHWITFRKDYYAYLDYLARERDADARLRKHFSDVECNALFAAHGTKLLVKLADQCTEIERLRGVFEQSIDDPEAWTELKNSLKHSFRRRIET